MATAIFLGGGGGGEFVLQDSMVDVDPLRLALSEYQREDVELVK